MSMRLHMWDDFAQATCMPDHCFCEAVHEGWLRQPSNAVSSLAFCVAAGWMALDRRRAPTASAWRPVEAWCFIVAVFLVGLTSAGYHASLTFVGQFFDVQSMYLVVGVLFAVNVDDARPGAPRRFLSTYVALNVALGVLLVVVPTFRRFGFGLAIAAVVLTEVLLRVRRLRSTPLAPLLLAVALQALAFAVWTLDLTKTVCAPGSLVQGHAVWHVLGAVVTALLWRYARTGPSAAS
ncbi:MAG: ceramidase domain-containing protein [Myxococcaceae bacterium]|nr:ceramidase domain-containing protein [Myxococcaceae bacterium]